MRVLVTGANGFVGRNLCKHLVSAGHEVTAAVRTAGTAPQGTSEGVVGDISNRPDWRVILEDQDAIIHLAARVHIMKEESSNPLSEFRAVNVESIRLLARAAAELGVRRFVYLSSIKVNGEATSAEPYSAWSRLEPMDPYGVSKAEGEAVLQAELGNTNVESVIVRTPLVYGPGVGGNFIRMLRLVSKELPLPLGGIRNRRSMVSIWNLSDLLEPATRELFHMLAKRLGVRSRVFRFPTSLLPLAGMLTGQSQEVRRLTDSLEVIPGSSTIGWNWRPNLSLEDGIGRTAVWYKTAHVGAAK